MNTAQMLADQARVFADFPTETIVIAGTSYECLILSWADGNDLELGGLESNAVGHIAIERSTIATMPTEGQQAVIASGAKAGTYRVGQVDKSDEADSVKIALNALP